MALLTDSLPSPQAGVGLQSISILFNAASIAEGALRPPFVVQIARVDPAGDNPATALLDILNVDATMQEIHTAQADVTEHPVEQGTDISDHVRPKPVELRLDGIVTETPLDPTLLSLATRSLPGLGLAAQGAAAVTNLLSKASVRRGAFDLLRRIRDLGEPVVIYTPLRTYSSMVMCDLQILRTPDLGEGLRFAATFREILTAESANTQIALPVVAQSPLDMGTQSTTPASAKLSKDISSAYQFINGGTSGGPIDTFVGWLKQQ